MSEGEVRHHSLLIGVYIISNRSTIEELRATVCTACPDLRAEDGVDEDKER